ncbi:MAG: hypothetical protein VKQ33_11000 [Candidatus Sericytochromatia bacterium]|nr:hypothetical protein [Candidatus Sericytochromatia bacterium]
MTPFHSSATTAALSAALLAGCAAPGLPGKTVAASRAGKVTVPVSLAVVAPGARQLLAAGDCDSPVPGGYALDDISSLTVHVDYAATTADDVLTLEGLNGTLNASSTLRLSDLEPEATATVWIEAYRNGELITADVPATSLLDTRYITVVADEVRPLRIAQRLKVAFKERPVVGKWVVNVDNQAAGATGTIVTLDDITTGIDASCTQAAAISADLGATGGAAVFGRLIVGHIYQATAEAGGTASNAIATFTLDPNLYDRDLDSNGTPEAGSLDLVVQ